MRPLSLVGLLALLVNALSLLAADTPPAYATETWPAGRQLTWAHPGQDGPARLPANWLEQGQPATTPPDKDADLILPTGPQPYVVDARGLECRHITIEKNAALAGRHGGRNALISAWGNIHVHAGGRIAMVDVVGDRHTVFKLEGGDYPEPGKRADIYFYPYGKDPFLDHIASHVHRKMVVTKTNGASVEFLGKFVVSDEIYVSAGTMIIGRDSEFRYNGRAGKGTMEIFDGATVELRDGAILAPHQPVNGEGYYNLSLYKGGTLQAGSPAHPLTRDAYLQFGPVESRLDSGRTGLYAAAGSRLAVYSADPTRARLVFTSTPVRPTFDEADYLPGARSTEKGVELYLAGDTAFNGVHFDYLRQSGLKLIDPTITAAWKNVTYGEHNAGPAASLIGPFNIKADIYYHPRRAERYERVTDQIQTTQARRGGRQVSGAVLPAVSSKQNPYNLRSDPVARGEHGARFVRDEPLPVQLLCDDPAASIYFTTDGSHPTRNTTRYTGPLSISTPTTIKAAAYKDGAQPSDVLRALFDVYLYQPASPQAPGQPGLHREFFTGNWKNRPAPTVLATLTPAATDLVPTPQLLPHPESGGKAYRFTGWVRVPADDLYIFQGFHEQGWHLTLDTTETDYTGTIALRAGWHAIQLVGTYANDRTPESPRLAYQRASTKGQPAVVLSADDFAH